MAQVIEICIVRNPIAHVDAHALPDFDRARVSCLELVLYEFQFLGIRDICRNLDTCAWGEPKDALLRKILRANAAVTGPFVYRPIRIVIDGRKSQLVQPAGNLAIQRDVPCRLTRPKGHAEYPVIL